jgi:AcrR family transcriptional regulator
MNVVHRHLAMRMSAVERRHEVLRAAAAAFAEGGYRGTTTQDVAERAGISQPYIFRLFDSKKELFLEVATACFERTVATFKKAAEGLSGEDALRAMGYAYWELIRDPVALLVQMHAFTAAAHDSDIRLVAQRGMRKVWETAASCSGMDAASLQSWLASGMLCNVIAALHLEDLDEPWAKQVMPEEDHCPVLSSNPVAAVQPHEVRPV